MIEYLEAAARVLWERKEYKDSADIMRIASKHSGGQMLKSILDNAIMCYFQANDVPSAFECLELKEKHGFADDWESKRDKANYLRYLNRHEEAYELVKNLPDNGTKYLALSWFLHKEGKFREAFEMAERGRTGNYWWGPRKPLNLPLWDGKPTRKIVIGGESGSGDEIIFARWIPELKKHCEQLYYYTDSSLGDVFKRNFNVERYDPQMHLGCVLAPSMSLPYLLKAENPQPLKYLTADSNNNLYMNLKRSETKRIGLCFHGEKTHFETNLRTIPYDLLIDSYKPLGDLINLQKDSDRMFNKLNYFPMNTWENTLLLIDACDLVVSCDTSIAHAAAALGKPTIVLMHAAAYFTWNHNDKIGQSSWYENAWCVNQTEPCKWEGSVKQSIDVARKLLKV